MKRYEVIILTEKEQKKIFGRSLVFEHGFVNEPRLDWWKK